VEAITDGWTLEKDMVLSAVAKTDTQSCTSLSPFAVCGFV